MYKSLSTDLEKFNLDATLHKMHKEGIEKKNFGMDNSTELIEGGFGIYSTANTKSNIGPVKTEYFRIGLVRSGSADFTIGLESFRPMRNSMILGFPGQVFSFQNPSNDFFTYYMLFSEKFISESLVFKKFLSQLPFLNYDGVQCFSVQDETALEVEAIIFKINEEVKSKKDQVGLAIRLYIQLIYLLLHRSYAQSEIGIKNKNENESDLFTRYLKLVSEHFLVSHKVADYAKKLHVSADHLNRIIKLNSTKTARELINEMILREAKAYLLYSPLTISEIGFKLNFSSSSHFIKFFRKLTSQTPANFKTKSD